MAWPDEKEALLATIRRQEQKSTALAKRFKLLQRTLQEQQKLLDKYQHALSTFQAAQRADAHLERKNGDGKLGINNTSSCKKLSSSTSPSWIQKKTTNSSDLGPVKENEAETQVKKQVQEKNEKTSSFKFPSKRAKSQLAATWAEEKEKMLKKHKWEQSSKSTTSNADKENVGTKQSLHNTKNFAFVEVVRNRDERRNLPAHDCIECKKYYDALGGLDSTDSMTHKKKCSRHRARFEPYQTPDDFWRLSFPDSVPELKLPSNN